MITRIERETKIAIHSLYKVFGPNPDAALNAVQEDGLSKPELLKHHNHVLGLEDINVDVKAGESQVTIEGSDGTQTLTADQIFLATGRRAKVEGLGLDEVGVAYDRGITVDDTCRTSMPSIRQARRA